MYLCYIKSSSVLNTDRECFSFYTQFYTVKILNFSHINFFLLPNKKKNCWIKIILTRNEKRIQEICLLPLSFENSWCELDAIVCSSPTPTKLIVVEKPLVLFVFRTCSSYINEYTCTYIH